MVTKEELEIKRELERKSVFLATCEDKWREAIRIAKSSYYLDISDIDICEMILTRQAECGDLEACKEIVKEAGDIDFNGFSDERGVFAWAAGGAGLPHRGLNNRNVEVTKWFVENGTTKKELHDEALYTAIENGKLESLKYLIPLGYCTDPKHNDRLLFKALACNNNNFNVLKYLMSVIGVEKSIEIINSFPCKIRCYTPFAGGLRPAKYAIYRVGEEAYLFSSIDRRKDYMEFLSLLASDDKLSRFLIKQMVKDV